MFCCIHCERNNLFPARQSAYRHHQSTETAMLIVHSDIVQAVDRGQIMALVFLDLSSAFYTVDHDCFETLRGGGVYGVDGKK